MSVIGIIGAMDEEIALFLAQIENQTQVAYAGITYMTGQLYQKQVVLVKSGVGKVNASVCTQLLIDRFQVTNIIFTGVAGALHPELEIGDIVISSEAVHHDMDATALGFKRGEIPFFPQSIFVADRNLVELAKRAAEAVLDGNAIIGRVLSGDQFVADRERVRELYETMNGACTEMEGAAVAQTAYLNHVPFVIIRSMSDKADGSAPFNFPEFAKLASKQSYHIVERMIRDL